jgi:hypothetical protein
MFIIEDLLYGTWGGWERKKEEESIISKYIASVQIDDIIIHSKSCGLVGDRRKGVRRVTEGAELTKVQYIHSWDTSGNPLEH